MVQTSFINYDKDMRYLDEEELALLKKGEKDTEEMGIWAVCRTSSLNDELGQIGWVFSGSQILFMLQVYSEYFPLAETKRERLRGTLWNSRIATHAVSLFYYIICSSPKLANCCPKL